MLSIYRLVAFALLLACTVPARASHDLIFLSGMEDCTVAFPDVDGDEFGDERRGTDNCARPASFIAEGEDCNDADPAVKPGVPDVPDAQFRDQNCDGIDGDIARAAFVAPGGGDAGSCTKASPCKTIPFALARVVLDATRDHVYVQAGSYAAQVNLAPGEAVFGGYDTTWVRAARSANGHGVTIQGGVRANGIVGAPGAPMLENLFVQSPAAVGEGESSIAVQLTNSSGIAFARVGITGGQGGPGASREAQLPQAKAGTGGNGSPGCESSAGCFTSCPVPPGGPAGTSVCERPGGVGGIPGLGENLGASGGTGAIDTPGGPGSSCGGSRLCDGTTGTNGLPGAPGALGSAGGAIGSLGPGGYAPASGGNATQGAPGNGGGGGGGGGGGDQDCDSYGSSGGGGGGGGCGGLPGTGGGGAGGSTGPGR